MKLSPIASCRTSTSPGPGASVPSGSASMTSGPPVSTDDEAVASAHRALADSAGQARHVPTA